MFLVNRLQTWFVSAFLATILMPTLIYAEDAVVDKILVVTEQFYPLNYTESGINNEKIVGYATALVTDVMTNSGLDFKLIIVPWTRAVNMIDNKENVIVFSMTRSPAREDKYHWIGSILPSRVYLFGLSKKFKFLPTDIDELKNYRIGSDKRSVASSYLTKRGFTQVYNMKSQNYLKLLERGRIDLFPYIGFSVALNMQRVGTAKDKVIAVMELSELSKPLFIAASKKTKPILIQTIKDAYQKTVDTGKFDEIMGPLQSQIEEILQVAPNPQADKI
ncbi:MAG: polar amino acid transport system substrate-binding protein [Candidatus Azotimanducaceae bacterium]|jgi:polar amino acid transport system substrate-binding protein